MDVTISLPDPIALQFGANPKELEREIRLSYALALYRAEKITGHEFGQIIGLEMRLEIDAVLKANGCFIEYTADEIAAQRKAIQGGIAQERRLP
jgi:hypothetical protein